MGRNKKLRIRIESLRKLIGLHLSKIAREQDKAMPDNEVIRHWNVEMAAWENTVNNLERRLTRGKRHAN